MTDIDKRQKLLSDPSLKAIFDDWRAKGTDVDRLPTSFLESVSPISQSEYRRRKERSTTL